MVHTCCVPFCGLSSRNSQVSFHKFTQNKKLQKYWIHLLKLDTVRSRRNPRPFKVGKSTKICLKHFKKEDFRISSEVWRLKSTAVPSIFPWTTPSNQVKERARQSSVEMPAVDKDTGIQENLPQNIIFPDSLIPKEEQNVNLVTNVSELPQVPHIEVHADIHCDPHTNVLNVPEEPQIMEFHCDPHTSMQSQPHSSANDQLDFKKMYFDLLIELNDYKTKSEAVQGRLLETIDKLKNDTFLEHPLSTQRMFSIELFKNNNENIQYYTGFHDYEIVKLSLALLFGKSGSGAITMKYRATEKHYSRKLTREDEYFLVLIKLRHNFGFHHLGTLFGISVATVGSIFMSWINYMYIKLGKLKIWPHRDILISNAPPYFAERYVDVVGFLDATEFFIQTPSSLVKQSQTYSQYKSHNTVKGLIVTDPNGAIIFVSSLFTGSVSDKKLIQICGLVDVMKNKVSHQELLAGDTFLADKGFKIQDIMTSINVNINIPVFRIQGNQFSPDEVNHTRKIAHERIHVERAIGRVKNYKILSQEIPIVFLGSFNQIWTVCCLLSNFKMPLRAR